jgi:hypothetical protein
MDENLDLTNFSKQKPQKMLQTEKATVESKLPNERVAGNATGNDEQEEVGEADALTDNTATRELTANDNGSLAQCTPDQSVVEGSLDHQVFEYVNTFVEPKELVVQVLVADLPRVENNNSSPDLSRVDYSIGVENNTLAESFQETLIEATTSMDLEATREILTTTNDLDLQENSNEIMETTETVKTITVQETGLIVEQVVQETNGGTPNNSADKEETNTIMQEPITIVDSEKIATSNTDFGKDMDIGIPIPIPTNGKSVGDNDTASSEDIQMAQNEQDKMEVLPEASVPSVEETIERSESKDVPQNDAIATNSQNDAMATTSQNDAMAVDRPEGNSILISKDLEYGGKTSWRGYELVNEEDYVEKNIYQIVILDETIKRERKKPARMSLPGNLKPTIKKEKRKHPLEAISEESKAKGKKPRYSMPGTKLELGKISMRELSIDESALHWEALIATKYPDFPLHMLSSYTKLKIPALVADYLKQWVRDPQVLSKLNTGALQKIPLTLQENFLKWFKDEEGLAFTKFVDPGLPVCRNCNIPEDRPSASGECFACSNYRATHHLDRPFELYELAAENCDTLCTNCFLEPMEPESGICLACDDYETKYEICRPRKEFETLARKRYNLPLESTTQRPTASSSRSHQETPLETVQVAVIKVPRKMCLNCNLQVAKYSDQCYACDNYERSTGKSRPARVYEAAAARRGAVFVPTPVLKCTNCGLFKQRKDETVCTGCFNYEFKNGTVRPLEEAQAEVEKRANFGSSSKFKEPERKSSHLTEYDDVFTDLLIDSLYLSFTTHKMNLDYSKKCKLVLT